MTNTSAMIALQSLRQTTAALETANQRVATGLRIADASDSPAYWSIATTARSDNSALGVVRDALALGESTVSVTNAGLEGVRSGLERVRDLLVSARTPGADRAAIQTEVGGLLDDVEAIAQSATINGENLLSVDSSATGYNPTASVVGSFERNGTAVTVSTIDLNVDDIKLVDPAGGTADGILDQSRTSGGTSVAVTAIDIGSLTDSAADMTTLDETIAIVDAALTDVISAQNSVGSVLSRIETQSTFISALMDANERAIGTLVDADMEAESTRLRMLQTQQQLAVQSLAIANSSSQSVLALFR